MESNAFDKSSATTPTSFFWSRAMRQSSVILISAVQQECPRRNPDILLEKTGQKAW